jgi:hypothetical protein
MERGRMPSHLGSSIHWVSQLDKTPSPIKKSNGIHERKFSKIEYYVSMKMLPQVDEKKDAGSS